MGSSAFDEQKDAATSAGDEAFLRPSPSGFASFADKLRGDLDKIATDDKDVLDALLELSEAAGKMSTAVTGAGEHVLHHLNSVATGELTLEIDQTIELIAAAAAAGEADWVMGTTRLLMASAEDITRHLTEAIEKEKAATGAASGEAVSGAGGVEVEEQAVDGDASLDDRAQQEMYEKEEEAFLDELDYLDMVLDVDEALDDLRLEAAGCSGDSPPTTGFLGRYEFFTLLDFLKLVDDAL